MFISLYLTIVIELFKTNIYDKINNLKLIKSYNLKLYFEALSSRYLIFCLRKLQNNIAIKTSRNSLSLYIYLFYQNNDIFLDKYLIKLLRFDFIISIINIVVKYEIEEKRGSERENRANQTKLRRKI